MLPSNGDNFLSRHEMTNSGHKVLSLHRLRLSSDNNQMFMEQSYIQSDGENRGQLSARFWKIILWYRGFFPAPFVVNFCGANYNAKFNYEIVVYMEAEMGKVSIVTAVIKYPQTTRNIYRVLG